MHQPAVKTAYRTPKGTPEIPEIGIVALPQATLAHLFPVETFMQTVEIIQEFSRSTAEVFEELADHNRLGRVFGLPVVRIRDGNTTVNGVGSVRRLKLGPLPAFEETTTTAEPNTLIEYKITRGSPLSGHWGRQQLTPTAGGGTAGSWRVWVSSCSRGACGCASARNETSAHTHARRHASRRRTEPIDCRAAL